MPEIILYILFLLTITSAFLVGYGNKAKRLQMVMVIGFALITTMTILSSTDPDGVLSMSMLLKKI